MIVSVDMAVEKEIQKESEIEKERVRERKISSFLILGRIIKQS